MLKFAIKVGLAGSAVYYLKEEGIWKESRESLKAYEKLNTTLEPYIGEVKKQIPLELPEIPKSANIVETAQVYWNKGITASFAFLSELPGLATKWTLEGYNVLKANRDIKKLLETSPTETAK